MTTLGVVRGVVVRSRSVFGTLGASVQTLFGGNISLFTELAERTRFHAFDTMLLQADMAGADAGERLYGTTVADRWRDIERGWADLGFGFIKDAWDWADSIGRDARAAKLKELVATKR